MKWLPRVLLCCVLACCVGCPPAPQVVKGVLDDVQMSKEDSTVQSLLLTFHDGRVIHLRLRYDSVVTFHKGWVNSISYDAGGTIQGVIVESPDVKEDGK